MICNRTMAHINLFAVIRNISDLIRLDCKAKEMIRDTVTTVQFNILRGPSLILKFSKGSCKILKRSDHIDIKLLFKDVDHFNRMMEGNATPIPIKGFTKLNFMTEIFVPLTERLEFYLKPTEEALMDEDYKKIHTELVLFTAGYSMVQIANVDGVGQKIIEKMPEGTILLHVENGPGLVMTKKAGRVSIKRGYIASPRAIMTFADMDAAFQLLNGKTDSYTSIATGQLRLSGFIPMIDQVDKLLFRVGSYLS